MLPVRARRGRIARGDLRPGKGDVLRTAKRTSRRGRCRPVELQAEVLGDSRVVGQLGDELAQLAIGAGQDHRGKSTSTRSAVVGRASFAVRCSRNVRGNPSA